MLHLLAAKEDAEGGLLGIADVILHGQSESHQITDLTAVSREHGRPRLRLDAVRGEDDIAASQLRIEGLAH